MDPLQPSSSSTSSLSSQPNPAKKFIEHEIDATTTRPPAPSNTEEARNQDNEQKWSNPEMVELQKNLENELDAMLRDDDEHHVIVPIQQVDGQPPGHVKLEEEHKHEMFMGVLKNMGIEYEVAEIALICTDCQSVENAVEFVFSNPEAIYHKFQPVGAASPVEMLTCAKCSASRDAHLIDENGKRLVRPLDPEIVAFLRQLSDRGIHIQSPAAAGMDANLITERRYSLSLSSEPGPNLANQLGRKRSGSFAENDSLSPEERQKRAKEISEKVKRNVQLIAAQEKDNEVKSSGIVCGICLDDISEDSLVKASCNHNYCRTCLVEHYRHKIVDANVLHLTCVDPNCSRKISDEEFRSFITEKDMLEKYEKFRRNAILAENPNTRWCPTPGCETAMTGSVLSPRLTCPNCKTEICFKCSERWHGRRRCSQVADQLLSDWAKGKDVQACPRCRARIWKNEGCNHMTCYNCKYEFCWLCRGRYSEYHFKEWNIFGCPGAQFLLEDENSWRPPHYCICFFRLLYVIGVIILIALGLGAIGIAIGLGIAALPFIATFYLGKFIRERYRERRYGHAFPRPQNARPRIRRNRPRENAPDLNPPVPRLAEEDDFEAQIRRAIEESMKPEYMGGAAAVQAQ